MNRRAREISQARIAIPAFFQGEGRQGASENYWYGWPPFTWIVTPVISTVAAEYIPSAAQHERDQNEIRRTKDEGGEGRWYKPWTW